MTGPTVSKKYWLSSIVFVALLTVVPSQAQDIYPDPVEPGVHPRLLFGPSDIPDIRRRAESPRGKKIIGRLRRNVYGHRDRDAKKLLEGDADWLAATRKDIKRGLLSKWNRKTRHAAMLYTATGDEKDGQIAVELFRLWLSTYQIGRAHV